MVKNLLPYIEKSTKSEIAIKDLSLRWFGPQKIEGLLYKDKKIDLTAETITIDSSLFSLLIGKANIGVTTIKSPKATVKFPEKKTQIGKEKTQAKEKKESSLSFYGTLVVENGQIDSIKQINGNAEIGKEGTFTVQIQANALSLTAKYDKPVLNAKGELKNFPVALIGKDLPDTFGNQISGTFELVKKKDTADLALQLESPKAKIDIETKFDDQYLSLARPAIVNFSFREGTADLLIDTLSIPYSDYQFDYRRLQFDGKAMISDPKFQIELEASSPALEETISWNLNGNNLSSKGNLNKLQEIQGFFKASNFPLPNAWQDLVGDSINVEADLHQETLTLSASNELFILPQAKIKISHSFSLMPLKFKISGESEDLKLQTEDKVFDFHPFSFTLIKEKVLALQFAAKEKKGMIKGDLTFSPLEGSIDIDNFSLPNLSPLVGDTFSLHLDVSKDLSVDVKAPLLSFAGKFSKEGDKLRLDRPSFFHWTLTQKGFATLGKDSPFNLASSAKITGKIKTLELPLGELDFKSIIQNSLYDLDLKIDQLSIDHAELKPLEISLSKKEGPMQFTVKGQVIQGGSLFLYAKKGDQLNLQGEIHRFPTVFFDALARLAGYEKNAFDAIFGKTVDAKFSLVTNGPVHLQVQSMNATASLDGRLQEDTLFLNQPMEATIEITPELSNTFLKKFDIYALSSNEPLRLYVSPEGFSVPLKEFDIAKVTIPSFSLNLGQVLFANKGSIHALAKLFKIKKSKISLWFANMDMQLKEGKLRFDRTEILLHNAYQIAFWGKINLVKQQVDMILGLTASALKGAFGVQKVSADYVMTVPIKGPFGDVKIDTAAATKKIAILLAKETGFAPSKGVWGEVFGAIERTTDDQSKVPPPKKPFPWQEQNAPTPAPEKPKVKKKKSKKTLNKFKKALSTI